MKPAKLILKNFGPYEDETIDFTKFDEASIFLIAGKTGSGKTTIFDALTFALYGCSASDDRTPQSMRSDFADTRTATEVTLLFEHQGQTYRIVRRPKQELDKERGTGTKIFESKGRLEIFKAGEKLAEITKMRDINLKLLDILQISREQFVQIVLLPQGEFRRFLTASSSDKEDVLRKIFRTQLYQRWSDTLKEMLKKQTTKTKDAKHAIDGDLAKVVWLDPVPVNIKERSINDQIATLSQQQTQANIVLKNLDEERRSIQKHYADASQKFHAAAEMNQQITQLAVKRQQQETLKAQQVQYDQLGEQAANLKWAKDLKPKYVQFQEMQGEISKNEHQLEKTVGEMHVQMNCHEKQTQQQEQLQVQKPQQDRRLKQKSVLEEQRPIFKRMYELQDQLKQAETNVAKVEQRLKTKEEKVAALEKQSEQITEKLNQVMGLTEQLNQLTQTFKVLKTAAKQLAKLNQEQQANNELKVRLGQNSRDLHELTTRVEQMQNKYTTLRSDWLSNQIVNLVKQLKPGTPCPVCGSTAHPNPAHIADLPSVSDDDIKAAETQLQQLQNQQAAAKTKLSEEVKQAAKQEDQLASAFKEFTAELIVEQVLQEIPADLETVSQQVATETSRNIAERTELQKQQADLKAEQEQQGQIKEALDQLKPEVAQLKHDCQNEQVRQQKYAVKLEDATHSLPSKFSDLTALNQHLDKIKQAIDSYDREVDLNRAQLEETKQTQAALQATKSSLEQQLKQVKGKMKTVKNELTTAISKRFGTSSWEPLQCLIPQEDQLADLQQQINDYQEQLKKNETTISTYEQIVGDHQLIDLDEEQTKLQQLDQVQEQLRAQYEKKYKQTLLNDELLKRVKENDHAIHAQQEKINQLQLLVETVNGSGDAKLGLERYVLQAQLKEILKVANQHLKQLSSGRYAMHLHKEAGAYQKNTGLEIDVYDDNVGQVRSVHTLSGGESFIAALSLALALGEVIQNESGGISIDTLFVDEGFGSLDQDSLSMAMAALENIESHNRMIGIISHVTMLQEQISYQIQVQTQGQGKSCAKIIAP
ncbi:AAA family ATPase [Liquorilactobacillus capillatus]|uniref:Nuclease SbcCD subunit C n=1 Tax=Liquorilactobacillus capillatus DSM 19910 TaxID=1423731 RepID=A0A0R1LYZ4_9LACO|nr:SMC family ATPase [Liquorilactobacillus capillatus]KRL00839.1 exonuclease SbcC [Liquorilactobacillus capillatus DSM 19910]